jgi:hypothetical protein
VLEIITLLATLAGRTDPRLVSITLELFTLFSEAAAARRVAERLFHGEFAVELKKINVIEYPKPQNTLSIEQNLRVILDEFSRCLAVGLSNTIGCACQKYAKLIIIPSFP